VTVDAYTVYYLPRNSLVPKLAMLCCAYHPTFQNLPSKLRVLDLGSGTGGVVLGLLDLFQKEPFAETSLDIVLALDASAEALQRQEQLVACTGFSDIPVCTFQADLSDPQDYKGIISVLAPYDIVFASNIFAELSNQATDTLLKFVVPLLSESGIIVDVESQSNYAMSQRAHIVKLAKSLGLHMYYPCPPELPCPKQKCWNWRTDEFNCLDIVVKGEAIETTKVHRAHWAILCRKPCTIYDIFHAKAPDIIWGVAAPGTKSPTCEGNKAKQSYEFCAETSLVEGVITSGIGRYMSLPQEELFKRGTIVGLTDDYKRIEIEWDIVPGFKSCDEEITLEVI